MEITGRLTGDAVVRSLSEDRKVVNFSVAVNDSYKAKNGERVTQTEFFDCSYWLGTGIAPYLTKGKIVELSGRVSVRAWIDGGGQAKAGMNFHTAKITLHGGQAATNDGTGKPQEAKAAAMEVTAEVVQGKQEEQDDLPF